MFGVDFDSSTTSIFYKINISDIFDWQRIKIKIKIKSGMMRSLNELKRKLN